MMTAMIKSLDSSFDSDDSDTPSLSHHKTKNKNTKSHKYKPNIKSKLLNLKNEKQCTPHLLKNPPPLIFLYYILVLSPLH